MIFTPKRNFYSDEFKSEYLQGFAYQVRPGNSKLQEAVTKWIAEGKVRKVRDLAVVDGVGTVTPSVWERIRSWL